MPTTAFITFDTDDAQFAALDMERCKPLLDQQMKFVSASEPTDIIWENRRFTGKDYLVRKIKAYSAITVLLSLSGIVIYLISTYSADVASIFPVTDCPSLTEAYGDQLQTYATLDY